LGRSPHDRQKKAVVTFYIRDSNHTGNDNATKDPYLSSVMSPLVRWRMPSGLHFMRSALNFSRRFGGSTMLRGTVKWFNAQKGYGFIQPQGGGGKDVFVHISAVERAGLRELAEGQVIEYEEVANKGKTAADNLKVQS